MRDDLALLAEEVRTLSGPIRDLRQQIGRTVVGQDGMVHGLLIGLLTNGHILLEGVPGLAKTLTVSTLARNIHATFSRIQFTPDLLPADLVGTYIYNPRDGTFSPRKGPIFANIVLADEINRAPAKVQSALLEAMQERQVTIAGGGSGGEGKGSGETYVLPSPFLVLATQNPIDQEGTYPLPEAQVDRFMLKVRVEYPTKEQEREILSRVADARNMTPADSSDVSVSLEQIGAAREAVSRIYVDEKIKHYIVDLVHATRRPAEYKLDFGPLVQFGASPRATINLTLAAKAQAFLTGRSYTTPHDVKSVAMDVLRHRVLVSYEAEAEGVTSETLVTRLLERIPAP